MRYLEHIAGHPLTLPHDPNAMGNQDALGTQQGTASFPVPRTLHFTSRHTPSGTQLCVTLQRPCATMQAFCGGTSPGCIYALFNSQKDCCPTSVLPLPYLPPAPATPPPPPLPSPPPLPQPPPPDLPALAPGLPLSLPDQPSPPLAPSPLPPLAPPAPCFFSVTAAQAPLGTPFLDPMQACNLIQSVIMDVYLTSEVGDAARNRI